MFFCSVAFAEPASEKEAEKLLSVMGLQDSFEQTIQGILDAQIRQNPEMQPYKEVMTFFFRKYMSYQSLKPEMIKLYAETFTSAELKQLAAFYQTDVGKKALEKMPELMSRGAAIGVSRVQEHPEELRALIQEEKQRMQLQKFQGQ